MSDCLINRKIRYPEDLWSQLFRVIEVLLYLQSFSCCRQCVWLSLLIVWLALQFAWVSTLSDCQYRRPGLCWYLFQLSRLSAWVSSLFDYPNCLLPSCPNCLLSSRPNCLLSSCPNYLLSSCPKCLLSICPNCLSNYPDNLSEYRQSISVFFLF